MLKRVIAGIIVFPIVLILMLLPEDDPAVEALEDKCYAKHMIDDRPTFEGRTITYEMCVESDSDAVAGDN